MPKTPEPTNLVLEQLRLMRADMARRFDDVDARFEKVDDRFDKLDKDISILRRQTIGEVYKANKTFASFADLEARLEAVERKVFAK